MPSSRRQSRQYQRSDLGIAPYAKPHPPSWAGRRGRCEICVRFAGTLSGRCVATCPPCGGKAMTPHQSPALRESAADSFSSRRSRLHLIRHAADRYKPHDTEGRGGTSGTPSPTKEGHRVGRDALIPPPIETVSAERSEDRSLREAMPSIMGGTSRALRDLCPLRGDLIRPLCGHLSAMRREGDDTSSVTRLAGDRRLTASPQGEAEGSSSVMRRGHLPPAGGRR